MSTSVIGVISDIKFYPLKADGSPNDWGKTHRAKATINGVIYDMGQIKPSPRGELQLRVQNGKDWVTLAPGDEVRFFAKSKEVNGKTYWDKEDKIGLVKKGNGAAAAAPSASGQNQPQSNSAVSNSPSVSSSQTALDVRIEDGQVFNNAMQMLLATNQPITPASIQTAAVTVRRALEAFRAGGCGRAAASPAPSVTTPAAPAAAATPSVPAPEFNEDDIPF